LTLLIFIICVNLRQHFISFGALVGVIIGGIIRELPGVSSPEEVESLYSHFSMQSSQLVWKISN